MYAFYIYTVAANVQARTNFKGATPVSFDQSYLHFIC